MITSNFHTSNFFNNTFSVTSRLFEFESNKALFLDLDHTIIKPKSGNTFPKDINDWEFIKGIIKKIKEYNQHNFKVLIVSNQGGIAKGYSTESETHKKFKNIIKSAKEQGVIIDDYLFSTTNRKTDIMRKPNPGMALKFAKQYDLNLSLSIMVGDMDSDKEFQKRAQIGKYIDIKDFINGI